MADNSEKIISSHTKSKELYRSITRKKMGLLMLLGILAIFLLVANVMVGSAGLSLKTVLMTVFNRAAASSADAAIIWEIRIPISLMALVVGSSLGIAGAEMQTVLSNPLASPYSLGIASAASFGAALAMVTGLSVISGVGQFLVPINAFVFAMLASMLIYLISLKKGMNIETMVLAGIAIMFLFQAALTFLQYVASEQQLQDIVFWTFGSLYKTTWPKLAISAALLLAAIFVLMKDPWQLTALQLGDERARSLGVDVKKIRLKLFVLISVLTGAAVCFVGTIGFIGLVAPHISRILVGSDQRYYMPVSALAGAVLLSAASLASKIIVPNMILPIGILTSFIGVPFFIVLILNRGKRF